MATSINTVQQGLHLHIEKPATATDDHPKARCRVCTMNGKKKVSRWVCSACPDMPGLCCQACFKAFHPSFEILLAARPITARSAPELPETNEEPVEGPSEHQDGQAAPELLSADDWNRRVQSQHVLIIKPPTKKKQDPKLKCTECIFQGRGRKDRRTICQVCRKGFCCRECLVSHHTREKIFEAPSAPPTGTDSPDSQDDSQDSQDVSRVLSASTSPSNSQPPTVSPNVALVPDVSNTIASTNIIERNLEGPDSQDSQDVSLALSASTSPINSQAPTVSPNVALVPVVAPHFDLHNIVFFRTSHEDEETTVDPSEYVSPPRINPSPSTPNYPCPEPSPKPNDPCTDSSPSRIFPSIDPSPDSPSPETSVSTKPCTSKRQTSKRQREQNSPPTQRVTRSQTSCKADTRGKALRNEDGSYAALDYDVSSPSSSD